MLMVVMLVRVIRKGQTSQIRQRGQTDLTFKLDFPGNLCRAAFAILAMFLTSGEGRTRGKTIN